MCAARCASAVFPWSIFFANLAFDCVYSCPQNTQVLAGSSRSFARDCTYAGSKVSILLACQSDAQRLLSTSSSIPPD